jgi:MFS family permease
MRSDSSSSRRLSNDDDAETITPASEITPLLSAHPTAEPIEEIPPTKPATDDEEEDDEEEIPLPLGQISLLCFTRLIEPIAFFSIFPYINQMIYETGGVRKEDVGFYSGLIESLFSLVQMCVMIFYGKAADKFGRKPVLVFSLCGLTVTIALFGLSKTLWQMILFRCLSGCFAGTIVTVRAMISENSTKKTQARAFSYFAFFGNIGIFCGPFIGGVFESPAKKFPSTLGKIHFFHEYPYALPGFMVASVSAVCVVVTALFVKETLHLHQAKKDENTPPMSTWELLKSPGVAAVIYIFEHVLLMAFAYTAVLPVFMFEPIELGGIGFSPFFISLALSVVGFSQALWLLFVFPPLHKRIGTGGVLRWCSIAWPFLFITWPVANWLRRRHYEVAFWTIAISEATLGSGVAMAFTANQLAVNDIAPSHETLGALNGIVMAISSGLRAVVPVAFNSIYAAGVKHHILGGQLAWALMALFAIPFYFVLRYLPEKAEGKYQKRQRDRV